MNDAAQESSGGQDNRASLQVGAVRQPYAIDRVAGHQQFHHLALDEIQQICRRDLFGHRGTIKPAIRLRPRSLHRWPLAAVQQSKLDPRAIGYAAHDAVERVDLADEMALPKSTNRGVARHHAKIGRAERDQGGSRAQPCGSQRGIRAGMAAANYHDIEV
ncbi:hypothetical protein GCM10011358_02460 [Sinisalibacter lacisalsi]|uniref:Uncharacterized protein n=1 Tax=Sinisalibacter lacisalsi TaxID=1526570 RepID=A0ABQ1QAY4_9RHOB|nr:hypothetical protein GCM10011358_02460 [Sinisalibacter lacisalsi]